VGGVYMKKYKVLYDDRMNLEFGLDNEIGSKSNFIKKLKKRFHELKSEK
jgi:hypothetical protein